MRLKHLLLFTAAVSIFSPAFAQKKSGAIAGSVKDANSKTPLIEAVITVSSQSFEGKKFAVTDSTGNYKLSELPAGLYTVSFEMEGFKTFTRENIQLIEGKLLGVSMEMARDRNAKDAITNTKKKKKANVGN